MSLPPLPQFGDEYDGRKERYLVESLENSFRLLAQIQAQAATVPINFSDLVTQGNIGAGETTLFTRTIVGQNITGIGWQIRIRAFGTFASNGDAKELKLYINNTVIYDSTGLTTNGGAWSIDAMIVDDGQNIQKNTISVIANNATSPATTFYSTSSENVFTNIIISLTGTATSNNDIVGQAMITTIQPIS